MFLAYQPNLDGNIAPLDTYITLMGMQEINKFKNSNNNKKNSNSDKENSTEYFLDRFPIHFLH